MYHIFKTGFATCFVSLSNIKASGTIICTYKKQFPGPEKETISGISFGFVFTWARIHKRDQAQLELKISSNLV